LADLVRCCKHEIVGVVGSGLEAIQAYNRYRPDLTACRNILAKDPSARIILVSGWAPSDDARESGAVAILPKPLDLDRLEAALNDVAESLRASAEATISLTSIVSRAGADG